MEKLFLTVTTSDNKKELFEKILELKPNLIILQKELLVREIGEDGFNEFHNEIKDICYEFVECKLEFGKILNWGYNER